MKTKHYDNYTIPDYFIGAIENGDYSGLNVLEIDQLEKFLNTLPEKHILSMIDYDQSGSFSNWNDVNGYLGSNCFDYVCYEILD